MRKMSLKEALALRLPNGTPLGDASPEVLEAEAARLEAVGEEIKKARLTRLPCTWNGSASRSFKEAFRIINEQWGK